MTLLSTTNSKNKVDKIKRSFSLFYTSTIEFSFSKSYSVLDIVLVHHMHDNFSYVLNKMMYH